jgi:hypothetical protein
VRKSWRGSGREATGDLESVGRGSADYFIIFSASICPRHPASVPHRRYPRVQDVPWGTETLLLVEDDEPVPTVARHILASFGYTDDAMIRLGALTADYTFLRKPFTRAELGHKVRGMPDESR